MNLYLQAINRFKNTYTLVRRSKLIEPTAVTLATADSKARPSARVVLLKGFGKEGFVFYTNQQSRKGRELSANPRAALCFFWDSLDIQIRVEGKAKIVSDKEADVYWATRPRISQIAAWASYQSKLLNNRATFISRAKFFSKKFQNKTIPRPAHWSGYCVVPTRIEFWKRRPFRMHERVVYAKAGSKWTVSLLYP